MKSGGSLVKRPPAKAKRPQMISGKSVQCSICSKKFSRTDHLKRHQLRHSGEKPYSCIFCHEAFTRSDNLRHHYPGCSERKCRQIPEAARGGRRSHACDSCTAMKLGCDGNNPCKTCNQKGFECTFSRLQAKDATRVNQDTSFSSSNRGSIKFLLNSGTASFIECFQFPPTSSDKKNYNLRNANASTSSEDNVLNIFEATPFPDEASIDWSVFEDENLLRFLTTPHSEMQMQSDDIFAPFFMDPNFVFSPNINGEFPGEWEAPSAQSAGIVQGLLEKAMALYPTPQEQADVLEQLNYLFTPSRMKKLIDLYFESWHKNCPILHRPTFDIEKTTLSVLVSVVMMGAMYSQVDREVSTAKGLLDLAELYIFSMPDLTEEYEIRQIILASRSGETPQRPALSDEAVDYVFSSFMIVCVQFWAGSTLARKRNVETRYGVVIKVARRTGLTSTRHEMTDTLDEILWIKKEYRIRLISVITLLDCALCFFSNFPVRLTTYEMRFDLPSEEHFFSSSHPFSETNFRPSRHLTAFQAYQSLFGQQKTEHGPIQGRPGNPLGLHALDMFILIHLLYVYTHAHIQFSALLPRSPFVSGTSTPATNQAPSSQDSNITQIKVVLARWRSLFTTIRSNIPNSTWAGLGFFKNGYSYWLVTHLLISNKGSVDVMMGMEVGCEDTLKGLKGLLRDGGAEG